MAQFLSFCLSMAPQWILPLFRLNLISVSSVQTLPAGSFKFFSGFLFLECNRWFMPCCKTLCGCSRLIVDFDNDTPTSSTVLLAWRYLVYFLNQRTILGSLISISWDGQLIPSFWETWNQLVYHEMVMEQASPCHKTIGNSVIKSAPQSHLSCWI